MKRKSSQIILRIEDANGYHIIRKNLEGWPFTIEGYKQKPDNYLKPPHYFLPLLPEEVGILFLYEGKEFRHE